MRTYGRSAFVTDISATIEDNYGDCSVYLTGDIVYGGVIKSVSI